MKARFWLLAITVVLASGCLPTYVLDRDAGNDAQDGSPSDAPDSSCAPGFHVCGAACADNHAPGSCGTSCMPCPAAPANATVSCDGTTCGFTCAMGFVPAGAACMPLAAPRPIAPLSTSTTTSQRPTFHWALAQGADGAHVQICRDRACATTVTQFDAAGTSGAPPAPLPPGVLFWRLQSRMGGTTTAATSPTWQFTVGFGSAPVDTSWGTTLDVNGDGFADLAVGASNVNSGAGRAYVYLGSTLGIGSTVATTLSGPDGGLFGTSIASAGDVNGDGFADLIVGAPAATSLGRAYLYFGSATGIDPASAAPLSGFDGAIGSAVASAGDVNGDGYADVVIGAPGAFSGAGRVYIYLGGSSGLGATPATSLTGPAGAGGQFGSAIASAGDVNGDGFADVLIGAYHVANYTGGAYVYLGSATGLSFSPTTSLVAPNGALGGFGDSVACAGDMNGDGYADIAIGAHAVRPGGRVYVYLGGAGALGTAPTTSISGPDGAGGSFGIFAAGAGDVNGDGFADLVVGAPGVNMSSGRVYVYLGSSGGLASTPWSSLSGPDGPNGNFGRVTGAGDINGDGLADLAVGGGGRVYVYVGGGLSSGSLPADSLSGPDGAIGSSIARLGGLRRDGAPGVRQGTASRGASPARATHSVERPVAITSRGAPRAAGRAWFASAACD